MTVAQTVIRRRLREEPPKKSGVMYAHKNQIAK